MLERNDVFTNSADIPDGRTPLSWPAGNGEAKVVGILLGRSDTNPDKQDKWSRTPLSQAAKNGHEEVVRILLERNDINPDKEDQWSRTPLSRAANNGHEEVVRILLERTDINPDKPDKWNRTPLLLAARNGHEGIVRRLLGRSSVDPNIADTRHGRTALSWAVDSGHQRIAELLQEQTHFLSRYAEKRQPTELPPSAPPQLSEPSSKRIRTS